MDSSINIEKTLAKRKISYSLNEPSDSEEESIADPKNALNEQDGSAEFNETVDLKNHSRTPGASTDSCPDQSIRVR